MMPKAHTGTPLDTYTFNPAEGGDRERRQGGSWGPRHFTGIWGPPEYNISLAWCTGFPTAGEAWPS